MTKHNPIAAWIAVMVLGLLLSACAGVTEPGEDAGGVYGDLESLDPSGRVVTYWYQVTGHREETLLAMIDDFNAVNEWGIVVRGEYAGQLDEIYHEIVAGIPSGRVPDLAVASPDQAAAYAAQGGLVELTPYIESEAWGFTPEALDDFFPFVEQGSYLPQLAGWYGVPIRRSMEVLYYNEDWLVELGYDHPPLTWEEFSAMACAASDPDAGTYGYELSVDPVTFVDLLVNQGGRMLNEDATAYAFDSAEGLAVLTGLQDLFNTGCATLEKERSGDQLAFSAGRVLFTIDSSLDLLEYRSAVADGAGFDWSLSLLPTSLGTPRPAIYGTSLSIFKTEPERQLAAWLFIKWFTQPEQQARWAQASSDFPVRASAADLMEEYLVEDPIYEKAFGFLAYEPVTMPAVAGYEACGREIEQMLAGAASGDDPQLWLRETVAECNASLEVPASADQ
ncbi:MAG: extracellular solute-binding protein [Anaerolineae bacterium]|jgi:multiple sugar transport system substrate-binding protein/sn-glycerol 3-phosphate transport system substrate-binding protein